MGNAQAFQRVRVRHFDDLLHQGPPDDIQVEVTYRDLGMILYTSGTTRPSKGVLMPHGHLYLFGLDMKVPGFSDLFVRLVFMQLSRPPPVKVL